jgi:cytosine deaminase
VSEWFDNTKPVVLEGDELELEGTRMAFDLLIKNAKTRFSEMLVDIGIRDGRIVSIQKGLPPETDHRIDAAGRLVTESFVNGHLHLCKVYTLGMAGEKALTSYQAGSMGKAMGAIELASKVKEQYDEAWIVENVRKALKLALQYGTTHIRAFADTDTKARLEGVKALIKARGEFKDAVAIQVVAFPQEGVVRDPGAEIYVEKALQLGADVVGGIPWIEYTDEDSRRHVDVMFRLAKSFDKDISMLVDDAGDPGLRTLEMLATKTIQENWEGRVMVHHARAMALYPEPYFRKIVGLLKRAKLGVVSDPHTGPLHARVKDLYSEGIAIALGQDDIADAYYPYGRNNMLEVAFLASHLMWMTSFEEMDLLYDLITTKAAEAMAITDFAMQEGSRANLVVLNAESVHEALTYHEAPVHVIKDGKEVTKRLEHRKG